MKGTLPPGAAQAYVRNKNRSGLREQKATHATLRMKV